MGTNESCATKNTLNRTRVLFSTHHWRIQYFTFLPRKKENVGTALLNDIVKTPHSMMHRFRSIPRIARLWFLKKIRIELMPSLCADWHLLADDGRKR